MTAFRSPILYSYRGPANSLEQSYYYTQKLQTLLYPSITRCLSARCRLCLLLFSSPLHSHQALPLEHSVCLSRSREIRNSCVLSVAASYRAETGYTNNCPYEGIPQVPKQLLNYDRVECRPTQVSVNNQVLSRKDFSVWPSASSPCSGANLQESDA